MIILVLLFWIHLGVWNSLDAFMIGCSSKCTDLHGSRLLRQKCTPDSTIHTGQEKLESSVGLLTTQDAMSFRPLRLSSSTFETDFLGMINFCLRIVDNTLSGPSRSKVLNEITNDVFKAIIIGYQPLLMETTAKVATYRAITEKTECKLDKVADRGIAPIIDNCDLDLELSMVYIDWLEDLVTHGIVHESVLGGVYDQGYKRLLTYLRDSGCVFQPTEASTGTRVPDVTTVPASPPKPTDHDICLSIMDARLSSTPNYASKTTELNHLANVVGRTMLYGGQREKHRVAEGLQQHATGFADRWGLSTSAQYGGSQEVNFIKVLAVLLTHGLEAAETVSAYNPDAPPGTPSLRLYDVYQNAFHRVVEMCLLDSKADYAPLQSDEIWLNFLDWEQGIRRNFTQELWKQNPAELSGEWELVDVSGLGSLNAIMTAPAEMLFTDAAPGTKVEFTKEGKVHLKHSQSEGISWCFRPGPAHLDTCEFYVQSGTKSDLVLKYVGFIDRGQRIESRFSRLPIRMTGRVLSLVRGQPQGSCRFVMKLTRT